MDARRADKDDQELRGHMRQIRARRIAEGICADREDTVTAKTKVSPT
jgi:hypothetical protein